MMCHYNCLLLFPTLSSFTPFHGLFLLSSECKSKYNFRVFHSTTGFIAAALKSKKIKMRIFFVCCERSLTFLRLATFQDTTNNRSRHHGGVGHSSSRGAARSTQGRGTRLKRNEKSREERSPSYFSCGGRRDGGGEKHP